jgi:V-type H+-transporting ATPase proteolipid subunit
MSALVASDFCPAYAPFFGALGTTAAVVFTCTLHMLKYNHLILFIGFGAAYGTAKSGVGIVAMGTQRPDLMMKSVVPVIMAGIIGKL